MCLGQVMLMSTFDFGLRLPMIFVWQSMKGMQCRCRRSFTYLVRILSNCRSCVFVPNWTSSSHRSFTNTLPDGLWTLNSLVSRWLSTTH